MMKSEFSEGDEVVIHFHGQDYTGVVKSGDGDITTRPSPPPDPQRAASSELASPKKRRELMDQLDAYTPEDKLSISPPLYNSIVCLGMSIHIKYASLHSLGNTH